MRATHPSLTPTTRVAPAQPPPPPLVPLMQKRTRARTHAHIHTHLFDWPPHIGPGVHRLGEKVGHPDRAARCAGPGCTAHGHELPGEGEARRLETPRERRGENELRPEAAGRELRAQRGCLELACAEGVQGGQSRKQATRPHEIGKEFSLRIQIRKVVGARSRKNSPLRMGVRATRLHLMVSPTDFQNESSSSQVCARTCRFR